MGRVVFVWPVPSSVRNAAGTRLLGFENAAARMGVLTSTIVPGNSAPEMNRNNGNQIQLSLYGSSSSAGSGFIPDLLRIVPSTIRLARTLKRLDATCVVASTPGPFIPAQSLIASGILGIPFILDVRDTWEMEATTHRGPMRNVLKAWLEGACAKSASGILCVTSGVRNRVMAKYRVDGGRTQLLTNGADLSVFHPGTVARDIDFVFLGSPAKYRIVGAVFESLARVRDRLGRTEAWFVGWADAPTANEARELARAKNLTENVRLTASIPHVETATILRRSRLGIVSLSGEEPFRAAIGAKTYEYIACGVPLACLGPTGRSDLREFVESRSLGFYATSPEEFASHAVDFLSSEAKWNKASENCVSCSLSFDRRLLSERALRESILPLTNTGGRRGGAGHP